MKYSFFFLILILLGACQTPATDSTPSNQQAYPLQTAAVKDDFNQYWYAGEAEISSYQLEQARYGEIRKGTSVFIFVTEPFSKTKQVKLDYPDKNRRDEIPVLKLNATRKFNTGIYPYSTMQSVFTPVDYKKHPNTLKVATSSQEWCGHTFEQLNFKKSNYEHQLFSYFESEGDQRKKIGKAWLEDELLNRIRIQPGTLPEGKIDLIPGTIFSRFSHVPLKVETANATLMDAENSEQLRYQISYPNLGRTLTIYFKKEFPHVIESWEETSAKNANLVSRATRIKTIKSAYWSKNGLEDVKYRKILGLD